MIPYQRAYSPKEVAKLFGVSTQHVRRLIKSGELAAFKVGTYILRISETAIADYLCRDQQKNTPLESIEDKKSSSTAKMESGTVSDLGRETLAELRSMRRATGTV
jgi:excisionase family DNA binding protein